MTSTNRLRVLAGFDPNYKIALDDDARELRVRQHNQQAVEGKHVANIKAPEEKDICWDNLGQAKALQT